MPSTTRDRARGVLLGMAAGDALGAPFEFRPPIGPDASVTMIGGGAFDWAPGEWTDDTSMAVPIVQVLADGGRLDDPDALGRVVQAWREWARHAPDVGTQTRAVLGRLGPHATEDDARAASEGVHVANGGRSAGNGSLMRTGPVVLAHLDDESALIAAARRVSELTHWEADAGDGCAIWCVAAARAVVTGGLDVRGAVDAAVPDAARRATWHVRLDEAERLEPFEIANNGWVVAALQAAWSAISRSSSLPEALDRAVRCGDDTDTVAAIAGQLAGARWGAAAVPAQWREPLHGWPGLRATDLQHLADRILDAHRAS